MIRSRKLLILLSLLLILLAATFAAYATDVPLSEHLVDSNFQGAQSIYGADMDGDGDLDLLGAANAIDDIVWWENTGGEGVSWEEHTIEGAFDGAIAALAADMDGDGDMDVLGAAMDAADVTWWENTNGDGSAWSPHAVDEAFAGVYGVYAADVDADGDLDVLGAASGLNDITWWENTSADGTSWTEHLIDGSFGFASAVYAADVDSDGDMDVLGAAGGDDLIAWWENDGSPEDGGWTEHAVGQNFDFAHSVHAADVDGDGDIDVLGAAINANDVTWWENIDGSGTNWQEHTLNGNFGGAHSVIASDLDHDGDQDILAVALNAHDVAWWENTSADGSSFEQHNKAVDGSVGGAFGVHAADVDGDGDMDILGVAANDNDVTWWENTSPLELGGNEGGRDGLVWDEHLIDGSFAVARSLVTADMDHDGDLDVIAAGVGANEVAWWENQDGSGTTWAKQSVDNGFTGAFWVHTADVDGDGDMDVLGAAAGANTIAWWENTDGVGTSWMEHTVDNAFMLAVGVYGADMDLDGDIDILGASYNDDDMTWWENTTGDGTSWSEHLIDGDYDGAVGIYVTDVDGDGDPDVLGAANLAEEFTWWENITGNGLSWSKQSVGTGFGNAESVYGADLDNDGDMDILGAAQNANTIAWWENTPSASRRGGITWLEHIVDDAYLGAVSVYAADIDGDGKQDMLGAAEVANEITWWKNWGGQFALPTTDSAATTIEAGTEDDMLRIVATHNGRVGDNEAQLATFALLLEETADNALTSSQANALIERLHLYLDDGSGSFEPTNDTIVTTIETLELSEGVQTVALPTNDPNGQVEVGTTRTYFVVVALTSDAHQQSPNSFRVTHLTSALESGQQSTAQDNFAIPLTLEYAANASSNITTATGEDATATPTLTNTPTATLTHTPTATATPTTATMTATSEPPTATMTATMTATSEPPTATMTATMTATSEPPTATMTATMSPTSTVIKATVTATVSNERRLYLPVIVSSKN